MGPRFDRTWPARETLVVVENPRIAQLPAMSPPHPTPLSREDADALNRDGNALRTAGLLDAALSSYEGVLAVAPGHAGALYNRASVLLQLDRPAEAIAAFDRLLAQAPDDPVALFHRGNACMALRRYDDALASFDRALMHDRDAAIVHNRRGTALRELGRPAEALACYERAALCAPPDANALLHRGIALQDLGREAEALECYDRALALRPRDAVTLNNRGNALRELLRPADALASYAQALAQDPGNAGVKYNRSLCRLLTGDFAEGWREYEARWIGEAIDSPKRAFAQPLWLGDAPLAGRTILLHAEQGMGDTLQFCRYAPLVAERGATVVLQVQAPLKRLLGSLAGASALIDGADALPRFDWHCPLLSLPLAFGTRLATIPANVPYLRATAGSIDSWRERLGASRRPRIGVAWSGNPAHRNDRRRSLPFEQFARLLSLEGQFVSLQRETRDEDARALSRYTNLAHFGEALRDFGDTAALIELMDLVITADTAVAHLAGAMGKPMWILLPLVPDWRWLLDRDDSPWYPTARLFRQAEAGDWDGTLQRVATALERRLETKGPLARAFQDTA
jgi:tetratricopeptide (TPR) repeat protein